VVVLASVLAYLLLKPVAQFPFVLPAVVSEAFTQLPGALPAATIKPEVAVVDTRLVEASPVGVSVAENLVAEVLVEEILVEEVLVAQAEASHVSAEGLAKNSAAEVSFVEKNKPKVHVPETYVQEDTVDVLNIEQADESLLTEIPNISITSHIYSSQAKRRSIVINNERLVEGGFVAAKVQVKEITHKGVILRVNDSLLAVSRSRGWNR